MEPTQPKSDCAKEPMQPKFGCAEESPNDDQETDTAGNGGHRRSSGPQLEKSSSATPCGRRNSETLFIFKSINRQNYIYREIYAFLAHSSFSANSALTSSSNSVRYLPFSLCILGP